MQTKPFILLTGDDSVRAEGIILVKRIVEKFADFQIVATKDQQSGMGAKISLKGGAWGKEIVDGHEAIWLDGSPADSVFFAFQYLKRKPDLVVSGMNLGENVSRNFYFSGTIAAALVSADMMDVPSVAFSMMAMPEDFNKNHDSQLRAHLLDYPGVLIEKIIKKALAYKFEPREFWSANFPREKTDKIIMTKPSEKYYTNDFEILENTFRYTYETIQNQSDNDVAALKSGAASITPFKINCFDPKRIESEKSNFENR